MSLRSSMRKVSPSRNQHEQSTSQRRSGGSWIPWTLYGLALGFVALILSAWLSGDVIWKAISTVIIFVAAITSFKKRCGDRRFWIGIALMLLLHLGILWLLTLRGIRYDAKLRVVGITGAEMVLFTLTIAVAYGGKRFLDEIEP